MRRAIWALAWAAAVLLAAVPGGAAFMRGRDTAVVVEDVDYPGAPLISARRMPAALEAAASVAALRESLTAGFASAPLEGRASCADVRTEGGAELFSLRAGEALQLASNTKLFTTAAALLKLGPDHRIKTKVMAVPAPGGGLSGPLYLVGAGDPYLATPAFTEWERSEEAERPDTSLADLADAVRAAGVKSVDGVVGVDTAFDSVRVLPTWPRELVEQKLVSPLSALSVNRNLTGWENGVGARVEFEENPAGSAAAELARMLRARGVKVGGQVGSGDLGSGLTDVASVSSAPLSGLAQEINSESDNFAAEMLLKYLGKTFAGEGSAPAGLGVVAEALVSVGLEKGAATLVDGSGLSPENRSSCLTITGLLKGVRASAVGGIFEESFPVAGASGTLKTRFEGSPATGRLRAKTGYLAEAAALSGYVETGEGSELVFSVLIGGNEILVARKAADDLIGDVLMAYPSAERPLPVGGAHG